MTSQQASRAVRAFWAVCLLGAGINHALILIEYGLAHDYGGGGWWFSPAYWSALTLIDPIVALMLFVQPRAGILATVALILTNVIHNSLALLKWTGADSFGTALSQSGSQLLQIAFLLFVLATSRIAWRGVRPSPAGTNPDRV